MDDVRRPSSAERAEQEPRLALESTQPLHKRRGNDRGEREVGDAQHEPALSEHLEGHAVGGVAERRAALLLRRRGRPHLAPVGAKVVETYA